MNEKALFYTEEEKDLCYFFYEDEGFYCSTTVNKKHPFNGPDRNNKLGFKNDIGRDLNSWANKICLPKLDDSEHHKLDTTNIRPGCFFYRMWRGNMKMLTANILAGEQNILSNSIVATKLILKQLFKTFEFIEPTASNFDTYSHQIRQVILLACMEVETSWTAILKTHNYQSERLTTNDYVKLLEPLRLSKYQVYFPLYPEIGIVTPFKNWNADKPTSSLDWYNDYNKIKHDRENNFSKSKLINALSAVAAVAIMHHAQFGSEKLPLNVQVSLMDFDPKWSYIPKMGNITRNTDEEGKTKGIGYNPFSEWNGILFEF